MRLTAKALIMLLLVHAGSAVRADEEESPPVDRFDLFDQSTEETLSESASYVGESLDYWVDRVDSFFVDEQVNETYRGNRLRVRSGATLADGGESDLLFNVSLNLYLPRTKRKLNLFVESLSIDSSEDDPDAEDADQLSAGLRWFLFENKKLSVRLDSGIKLEPEPQPFSILRLSRTFQFDEVLALKPVIFPGWQKEDGFGLGARLDLERGAHERVLLRNRSETLWSEAAVKDDENVEWSNVSSLIRTLSGLRGIRGEFQVRGVTAPANIVEEYRTLIRWRQAFFSDWLFYEIAPFLSWERDGDWETSPGATLLIEVNFERSQLERAGIVDYQ